MTEDQPMRYTIQQVLEILSVGYEARKRVWDKADDDAADLAARVETRRQARLDKIAAGDEERELTRLSMPRRRKTDESQAEFEARIKKLQERDDRETM